MLQEVFNFIESNTIVTIAFLFLIFFGGFRLIKYILFQLKVFRNQKQLAQAGMKDIDKMDGLQFEAYLKALLKELGYKAKVTTGSHDFGADLIMKNDNKKIVIQAKRYGYKNHISLNAVQEIFTAQTYYKANQSIVITNSMFTKSARELAKACNVKLYDRYKLAELINKVQPDTTPNQIQESTPAKERKCKTCGGTLVQRKSKAGNFFLGCSNYPKCTHTEPIAKD